MTDDTGRADVYLHLGNSITGEVGSVGPFDFVQVTYNSWIRVGNAAEYDGDFIIATFQRDDGGYWKLDDGSRWTDLTVSTAEPTDWKD